MAQIELRISLGQSDIKRQYIIYSHFSHKIKDLTDQTKKRRTKRKGDIDGCNEQFRRLESLKRHQLTHHPVAQPIVFEEIVTTPEQLKEITCTFNGCGKVLKDLDSLKAQQSPKKHSNIESVIIDETDPPASRTKNRRPKPRKSRKNVVLKTV